MYPTRCNKSWGHLGIQLVTQKIPKHLILHYPKDFLILKIHMHRNKLNLSCCVL